MRATGRQEGAGCRLALNPSQRKDNAGSPKIVGGFGAKSHMTLEDRGQGCESSSLAKRMK